MPENNFPELSIPVSAPFLPPLEDYIEILNTIWDKRWLTNNGPLLTQLENKLAAYLGVPDLVIVANGTLALQIAIKAMGLRGKILTTPFSYIATTNSIIWEGCEPVFCDIDEEDFNIDPDEIERNIDADTSAILATHVFGAPCQFDPIRVIAEKHSLKIIYDASHAFGIKVSGETIFENGNASTLSFHATKTFNTVEGGAILSPDSTLLRKARYLRNFGHDGPYRYVTHGINGKMSEFHAAMGLCNLDYIDEILTNRKSIKKAYIDRLDTDSLQLQKSWTDVDNITYMPVVFSSETVLEKVMDALSQGGIQSRRYFYPSLDQLPFINRPSKGFLPISSSISGRILCLPLYHDLELQQVERIASIVNAHL